MKGIVPPRSEARGVGAASWWPVRLAWPEVQPGSLWIGTGIAGRTPEGVRPKRSDRLADGRAQFLVAGSHLCQAHLLRAG